MKPIALVTNTEFKNLTEDDQLLIQPLIEGGFDPRPVVWNDNNVNWDDFSMVIIRSPWGYYREIDNYFDWLDFLEMKKIKVWNPIKTLRWNANKQYLFDLEQRGVPIIPTVLIKKNTKEDKIRSVVQQKGWEEIVIKPVHGAGGNNIIYGNAEAMLIGSAKSDVLIQPLIKEVVKDGEYSFIFIGGEYSHTMLKVQTSNELNVTRRFSIVKKVQPSEELIQQATKMFNALPKPLMYARIDGVRIKDTFYLIETELIEPILYFGSEPKAVGKFLKAIRNF